MNFVQKVQHRVFVSTNCVNLINCHTLPKTSPFMTKSQNYSNLASPTFNAQIDKKRRSVDNSRLFMSQSQRQNFPPKLDYLLFGNDERKSFEY